MYGVWGVVGGWGGGIQQDAGRRGSQRRGPTAAGTAQAAGEEEGQRGKIGLVQSVAPGRAVAKYEWSNNMCDQCSENNTRRPRCQGLTAAPAGSAWANVAAE